LQRQPARRRLEPHDVRRQRREGGVPDHLPAPALVGADQQARVVGITRPGLGRDHAERHTLGGKGVAVVHDQTDGTTLAAGPDGTHLPGITVAGVVARMRPQRAQPDRFGDTVASHGSLADVFPAGGLAAGAVMVGMHEGFQQQRAKFACVMPAADAAGTDHAGRDDVAGRLMTPRRWSSAGVCSHAKQVLFVETRYADPNITGVDHFLKHSWTGIRKQVPDVTSDSLCVPGDDAPVHVWQTIPAPVVRGDDEDISGCSLERRVVSAPIREGAGTHINRQPGLSAGYAVNGQFAGLTFRQRVQDGIGPCRQ
jgi:hypothetical protein